MFRKKAYYVVNIFVLSITFAFFTWQFLQTWQSEKNHSPLYYLSILLTVAIVYATKLIRLYLIIYDLPISRSNHLLQFVKTVSVNTVLPLKSGELFRIYCYGYAINSLPNSIVCILLERFSDTLALATLILIVSIFFRVSFSFLFYLILLFLISIIIIFFVFPPAYSYWNQYYIEGMASPLRLKFLGFLEKTNSAYLTIKKMVRSRGIALFFISLVAWGAEVIGYYFINTYFSGKVSAIDVFRYLESAMGLSSSDYQNDFVTISVIASISIYCILNFVKRVKHEEL